MIDQKCLAKHCSQSYDRSIISRKGNEETRHCGHLSKNIKSLNVSMLHFLPFVTHVKSYVNTEITVPVLFTLKQNQSYTREYDSVI